MQVVERAILPANEITVILGALNALKRGDASVRLPADWPGSLGRVADVFNDVVERWVREDPGQWMWFHKRWEIGGGRRGKRPPQAIARRVHVAVGFGEGS